MKDPFKNRLVDYWERQVWFSHKSNKVCFRCKHVFSGSFINLVCPTCGKDDMTKDIGIVHRAPRKRASKKKWKEFAERVGFEK